MNAETMPYALWLSSIILGLVFGVAAVAKLRDRVDAREAFIQLGIHQRWAPAAWLITSLAELAVAAALFVPQSAPVGAAAAAVLLIVFSLVVGVRLARGEHPSCSCFGRLGTGRIGAGTLGRNGALLAVASLVAVAGLRTPELFASASITARERAALTAGLLLIAAVAFQGWMILKLMRQSGRLLMRTDRLEELLGGGETAAAIGLALGTTAPDFRLEGIHGESVTLASLLASQKRLILMFTDPGCGPCAGLMPDLARWQRELAGSLTIAVVSRGARDINRAQAAEYGLNNVLIQHHREVSDAYHSPGTPSAVLIEREGIIGSPIAAGVGVIRALVDSTTYSPEALVAVHPNGGAHDLEMEAIGRPRANGVGRGR